MANCLRQVSIYSQPPQKKYRNNMEIAALMLEAVRGPGIAKFSIMKRTSVNSAQLREYLISLTEIGFIEVDCEGDRAIYKATDRGLEFLKQYNVLQRMISGGPL